MWSRILRANAAYAVGSAANSAALLLLVPFLVNRLSVAEYGAWSLFDVAIVLLNLLMLAGADVGLMREHWSLDDEEHRRRLAGTVALATLAWSLSSSLVLVIVGFGASAWLPELSVTRSDCLGAALSLGIACAETLFALLLSVLRIRERAPTVALLGVARMFAYVVLTIVGVESGGGVQGALLGRLGAAVFAALSAAIAVRKSIRFSWQSEDLRRVLRYGLPLLPASLAGYVLLAADRYILQRVATLEVVACYSFAYKIASVLEAAVTRPFGLDWAPRRFRIATESDAPLKYNAAMLFYLFAASVGVLGLMALTPSVYAWLAPPAYGVGQTVIPILLAAYLVLGMSVSLNVGIMLKDKTRYLPRIFWSAALVCTVLSFWWIPRYGMIGAAWATLVGNATLTLGIAWVSSKFYPIAYTWAPVVRILLVTIAGGAGMWLLQRWLVDQSEVLRLVVRLFWVAALSGALGLHLWRGQRARLRTGSSFA